MVFENKSNKATFRSCRKNDQLHSDNSPACVCIHFFHCYWDLVFCMRSQTCSSIYCGKPLFPVPCFFVHGAVSSPIETFKNASFLDHTGDSLGDDATRSSLGLCWTMGWRGHHLQRGKPRRHGSSGHGHHPHSRGNRSERASNREHFAQRQLHECIVLCSLSSPRWTFVDGSSLQLLCFHELIQLQAYQAKPSWKHWIWPSSRWEQDGIDCSVSVCTCHVDWGQTHHWAASWQCDVFLCAIEKGDWDFSRHKHHLCQSYPTKLGEFVVHTVLSDQEPAVPCSLSSFSLSLQWKKPQAGDLEVSNKAKRAKSGDLEVSNKAKRAKSHTSGWKRPVL